MIINGDQLKDIVYVVEKLKLKYQIFYISDKNEANKELPPPDTVYIFIQK
ncbi:hypothetical protein AZ270_gp06 [Acidianus tailed spindle virus]|nr:hypothetical protein AZ270_gp06 [Acidianus tailed spindle virus]AME30029.1 hypothetical protein ATSV_B49 [Acidianus tailed spindle virus]